MRGLTQLAALLSSALGSAFPIPRFIENDVGSWSGRVIHHEDTRLNFAIDGLESNGRQPIFDLRLSSVATPCGESNVILNGQQLEVEWDGLEASGHGQLDAIHSEDATWSIQCLQDDFGDGAESSVHLLRLKFKSKSRTSQNLGFTVSYKPTAQPSFLRFVTGPDTSTPTDGSAHDWSQPTADLAHTEGHPELASTDLVPPIDHLNQPTRGVGQSILALGQSVSTKIGGALKKLKLCDIAKSMGISTPEHDKDVENTDMQQSTPTSETSDSTNTYPSHLAAETRSLNTFDDPSEDPSSTSSVADTEAPHNPGTQPNYAPFKVFGLVMCVLCLVIWLWVRYKDPRRRADRAAQREERRTKRLYKRAAQKHMIKNWFSKLRIRYWIISRECLDDDEKQLRVKDQEGRLEAIVDDDLRALRDAHRVISNLTASEDSRDYYQFDAGSSRRRQSVSTLPGYESEGSQPPAYDDPSRSFRGGSDTDPDSSIVSTSPRLSRDGTNSDFDEKIEVLSLDHRGMTTALSTSRQP